MPSLSVSYNHKTCLSIITVLIKNRQGLWWHILHIEPSKIGIRHPAACNLCEPMHHYRMLSVSRINTITAWESSDSSMATWSTCAGGLSSTCYICCCSLNAFSSDVTLTSCHRLEKSVSGSIVFELYQLYEDPSYFFFRRRYTFPGFGEPSYQFHSQVV